MSTFCYTYKFISDNDIYNPIKNVDAIPMYIYQSNKRVYTIVAHAKKETDLVLFVLNNPHLKLVQKEL